MSGETARREVRALSESTAVTIGAAAAVVIVAFWGGVRIGSLTTDVDTLKQATAAMQALSTNNAADIAALKAGRRDAQQTGDRVARH